MIVSEWKNMSAQSAELNSKKLVGSIKNKQFCFVFF